MRIHRLAVADGDVADLDLAAGNDAECARPHIVFHDLYRFQRLHSCPERPVFIVLPVPLVRLAGRLGDGLRALGVRTMLCTLNVRQILIEEWYDNGKATRELGLPHTPVEDAVRDFFSWREARSR